jgi:hypothetical protein
VRPPSRRRISTVRFAVRPIPAATAVALAASACGGSSPAATGSAGQAGGPRLTIMATGGGWYVLRPNGKPLESQVQ